MKKLLHSYEIWNLEKLRFSQLKHSLFTHVFCTVTVWDLYVSLLIYYPTTHTHTHTRTHSHPCLRVCKIEKMLIDYLDLTNAFQNLYDLWKVI